VDLRTLQKLQRDTGFNVDFIEKAHHITRILSEISENRELGKNLALKGGTVLNFVYLNIPRLSIDIDLNFVGALEKGEMLGLRPHISEGIQHLAEKLGYEAVMKPSSYIIDRFLLKYPTLKGTRDSIKVEINYLERASFVGNVKRDFKHFFTDIPKFKVNTYTVEEICAMKTKAMVERLYARDIFDMYNISKLELKKEVAKKLMVLYMLMAKKRPEVKTLVSKIRRCEDKEIIRQVAQFVRQGYAVNATTVKRRVADFYESVFKLDSNDRKFLKRIEDGIVELDVLFDGIRYNKEAQKHPSLCYALKRGQKSFK